jgi:hypothetical protein
MDQDTLISELVHDPSDPESVREAIAVIKAEYGVTETRAYAILIRASVGCPLKPVDHRRASWQPTLLAG